MVSVNQIFNMRDQVPIRPKSEEKIKNPEEDEDFMLET